ncbi:MAG TPA: histone deacetylase [Spirochaetia bacterium]|nr:histone deacetylase [Spirochaetia bacterium]
MRNVTLFRDPLFSAHENGPGHPERPERLAAIDAMLAEAPFISKLVDRTAPDATIDQIARIHERSYIERMRRSSGNDRTYLDPDTSANRYTYAAAVRAAGAAVAAVDLAVSGEAPASFVLARPPGHHAERSQAMGFCIFNSIAIGALHAIEHHRLERVAIIDWDVHHGNGTMHSLYNRKDVLYVSLHQYPHYPGTGSHDEIGSGDGEGYTLNLPLGSGMGDDDYLMLFRDIIVPVLDEYRPELLLVSAGFDAHRDDPLAEMALTDTGFRGMTHALRAVADRHAKGRLIHLLEGGYNLQALASGVRTVLEATAADVADSTWPDSLPQLSSYIRWIEKNVKQALSPFWLRLR